MRPTNLLLQSITLAATASATSNPYGAYLWTVDQGSVNTESNQVQQTTSQAAEGILVRRKGLPDSAYNHIVDEDILSDIKQYGGYQEPLFGTGKEQALEKLFVRISGYTGSVTEFDTLPDLWIEDPTTGLLDIFESKFDIEDVCEYRITPKQRPDVSIQYTYRRNGESCKPQREIEMLPTLLVTLSTVPTSKNIAGKGISSFHRNLHHLRATGNVESTVLVLPPTKYLAASKDPAGKTSSSHHAELRRRAETPLEITESEFPKLTPSVFKSNSSHNNGSSHSLPKQIPQCFSSLSSCRNTTNNCSGHGECVKKSGNCYTCSCKRTSIREGKTVLWGGNACQKKDVSAEFNLFAGVGIVLFTIAAAGVGMLFRMGAQDLPSVIGAGVVGPRAQK